MKGTDQHHVDCAFSKDSSRPRGVYAVTPDDPHDARLLARCEKVLAGGARWLQYRNKTATTEARRRQVASLLPLCRRYDAAMIINDDVELAVSAAADGVHLGSDDGSIADARRRLGDHAIIGASCYNRMDLAEHAAAEGASYVAFGAFFPSPTKPNAVRATSDLLIQSTRLQLPRVAIGGINADNAASLIDAGADLIAVISAVFDAADPERATRQLAALF